MNKDIKPWLHGAYSKDGNLYVNKGLPVDHIKNNVLLLECSVDSGIIGFDCDVPDSVQAEQLRKYVIWEQDLISHSSEYTLQDVIDGKAKFKVFFEFNSTGAKKNKNNKNVEVVYDTGGRSQVESKTLALFGKRFKDEFDYVVVNSDKSMRYLPFEPQEVLSHKSKLKLFTTEAEHEEIEKKGSAYGLVDIEDGEEVNLEEFEKLLVATGVEFGNIEISNDKLLTFKCLFPNAHSNMSGANAYAFKKDGVYVCKCHGSVCSHDYSWLNQKLKEVTILTQELDFDYEGFNFPDDGKHIIFEAKTGWGKTERLAQEVNLAIQNKNPLMIVLQNKESISRLLDRVDYFSGGLLPMYMDAEEISVYTSEGKNSLNEFSTVIITHHYYYSNCGDILTYYAHSKLLLDAVQRTVIVDEGHTWLEMITRLTLEIGGCYEGNGTNKKRISRKYIRGNRSFNQFVEDEKLTFTSECVEAKIDGFSNMKFEQQYKIYPNVIYEDINKEVRERFTLLGTQEEDNYVYKYYTNPNPQESRPHNLEDGVLHLDKLLDSANYAVVSLNVGDNYSRKNIGQLTMMLQHYSILRTLIQASKRVVLLSATFSEYHMEVIDACFDKYNYIEVPHVISKVREIVVLKSDKKSYKHRKTLFTFLNDLQVPSLLFMATIANAKQQMLGLNNAMLNDNGMYCVGARNSVDDYVDNMKRNLTFAGLESSVAKGYNYLEEIEGDGFELIYFDSLPTSPPLIKKYVKQGQLVDYNFDYVKHTFAQAIGRAFRKDKDRLVIALNDLKGEEEVILDYLGEVTDARLVVDEMSLTNLKISLKSYVEHDFEKHKEAFKENHLFAELYLTQEEKDDILELFLYEEEREDDYKPKY